MGKKTGEGEKTGDVVEETSGEKGEVGDTCGEVGEEEDEKVTLGKEVLRLEGDPAPVLASWISGWSHRRRWWQWQEHLTPYGVPFLVTLKQLSQFMRQRQAQPLQQVHFLDSSDIFLYRYCDFIIYCQDRVKL